MIKLREIMIQILEAHLDDGFITEVDFDSIVNEMIILCQQYREELLNK